MRSDGWLILLCKPINIDSAIIRMYHSAWVWFNWPNLAMLFMSDAPVKFSNRLYPVSEFLCTLSNFSTYLAGVY